MNDIQKQCHDCRYCPCFHHKIVPLLVLIGGIMFLLQAVGSVSAETNALIWPILVIVGAVTKLTAGKCGCYKNK